jgi:hypothetical protein
MRNLFVAFALLIAAATLGVPSKAEAAPIGAGITTQGLSLVEPVWHRGYSHYEERRWRRNERRWRRDGRRCRVVVRRVYDDWGNRRTVRRRICRW